MAKKKKTPTPKNGVNHQCFTKQFSRLSEQAGGRWVVIAGGHIVRIGSKHLLKRMVQQARAQYPNETPLVAPLPTEKDLQCIL